MIKLFFLFLLLVLAACVPVLASLLSLPEAYIKCINNIDWIAWYAALLSLYGFYEKYQKRNKDFGYMIYVSSLVNQLEKMDEVIVNIDILQKMTINEGLDKRTQKVEQIQESATSVFSMIASKLGNVDQHFKSSHKKIFNEDIEENIYPKFSHLLQNIKQTSQNQENFKKSAQMLHNSIVKEKEKLVQIIQKIHDKC
jgi:hypothetical protein